MERILVVEDEPKISDLLTKYLQHSNYHTHVIHHGNEVMPWLNDNHVDMILLDLMLPGKSGVDICKSVRSNSNVPIIMITAKVEEIDRLLGLELGADDYICKPFSPREVVARVKAVLRRHTGSVPETSKRAIKLDKNLMLATLFGEKLDLTAVEFQLLSLLVKEPGRVFSRDQLIDNLYSDHRVVSDRTIDSHIKKLRKKIAVVNADVDLIHSVYGVGYKYETL